MLKDNGFESTKTISVIVKDDSATGGINGDNSNNDNDKGNNIDSGNEDDKITNNKNDATMPATGGFASSLGLVSVFTMLSGCWFIGKRKK